MNLRNAGDNKKKLEEFNKHSKELMEIVKKRQDILNDVDIVPGQIWEKANGKRVVVMSLDRTVINFIQKTGKHAFQQSNQKKETFVTEIYMYLGIAGATFVEEFANHDGRLNKDTTESQTIKKNTKAVQEDTYDNDIPF
jgi:hypothetical protein